MHTAEARVETDRPSRYLVQLCQHVSRVSDQRRQLHRRPATGHAGDGRARDEVRPSIVEASDDHAVITFAPWGTCTLRAGQNALTLRVEATDEDNLRQLRDILTGNLTRFGRRDGLRVNWDGPAAPTPGDGTDVLTGSTSRRPRWVLGAILVKLGIVALILALPSGLAISLGAGHVVALLVMLVAGAVTLLVNRRRHGHESR